MRIGYNTTWSDPSDRLAVCRPLQQLQNRRRSLSQTRTAGTLFCTQHNNPSPPRVPVAWRVVGVRSFNATTQPERIAFDSVLLHGGLGFGFSSPDQKDGAVKHSDGVETSPGVRSPDFPRSLEQSFRCTVVMPTRLKRRQAKLLFQTALSPTLGHGFPQATLRYSIRYAPCVLVQSDIEQKAQLSKIRSSELKRCYRSEAERESTHHVICVVRFVRVGTRQH